jgi:hypothetical protein
MLQLPLAEKLLFLSVMLMCLHAAVLGVRQLRSEGARPRLFLFLAVIFAILLEGALLGVRAKSIESFHLTGLFDSMLVLTVVFGVTFLILSLGIRQVWFGSVMSWLILFMVFLAGFVAKPAAQLQAVAISPWVSVHAALMVLFGVAIAFTAGVAFLFLVCRWKLNHNQIINVIGKIPNFLFLGKANGIMLIACFVLMTFGMVSGIGLAVFKSTSLGINASDWIFDAKMLLIVFTWAALGLTLLLRRLVFLSSKSIAIATIVIFTLILLGLISTSLFDKTAHDFASNTVQANTR